MSYDDPWLDDDSGDGGEDSPRWRPTPRAALASLALGTVAALSLPVTMPAAGRGGALGTLALGVTCTLSGIGTILGVGALFQRGARRGYAWIGLAVNALLLALSLGLAAAQ